jgi:hypothetical protein
VPAGPGSRRHVAHELLDETGPADGHVRYAGQRRGEVGVRPRRLTA